ncbi:MAG TPA: tryptophan synthase subunit alpha [Chitinophagaceae bacterium]|nr:tryptophan synthase subunit alpha [Chitinophagaceae bacterium]
MKEYNENLHNNAKGSTYENAKFLREFKTKAEDKLWQKLRDRLLNNLKFRRQHPFGEYVLDFYCHEVKLCIEVDGNIHNDKLIIENDKERTKVLNDNGINVIRFKNQEIIDDINKVLKKIVESSSIPLSKRRGVRGEVTNRIDKLFSEKQNNILNVYCTAGFPGLEDTLPVLHSLQKHGADMVEIGMPYSDPLADGPVIQQSSMIALQNGMTIQKLFEQLKDCRTSTTPLGERNFHLPLILMGYLNPVLQFGIEKFCRMANETGVDGIILPDIPLYEYENEYKKYFEDNGLHFIFLITPETSEERIRKIDKLSKGFIYAVSSSSTTGSNKEIDQQESYFLKLQKMNLNNPVLVGFGIKDKQTFQAACKYTNGAIIGTAYIKALENTPGIESATQQFLNGILR